MRETPGNEAMSSVMFVGTWWVSPREQQLTDLQITRLSVLLSNEEAKVQKQKLSTVVGHEVTHYKM